MKKAAYILLALASVACTSTEYVEVENLDPVLVVNSQMVTSDNTHIVHLSTSSRAKISAVKGGSVTVSINSGTPIVAKNITPEDEYRPNSTKFAFDASLKPGDVVEIKAKGESLSASASTIVPQLPLLQGVDVSWDVPHSTSSGGGIFNMGYDGGYVYYDETQEGPYKYDAWHLFKINMKDPEQEENFYRLSTYVECIISGEGNTDVTYQYVWPDTSSEPLLSTASSEGSLLESLTEDSNRYNVFPDPVIQGKEYSIKLYIMENQLAYYRKYHNGNWYYDEETGEYYEEPLPEGYTYQANLVVKLYSISKEQYIYIKALGLSDMGLLFSEPVSIPSNVEGGYGFVAVDSCTEAKVSLSE